MESIQLLDLEELDFSDVEGATVQEKVNPKKSYEEERKLKVWKDKSGKVRTYPNISNTHLDNIYNLLTATADRLQSELAATLTTVEHVGKEMEHRIVNEIYVDDYKKDAEAKEAIDDVEKESGGIVSSIREKLIKAGLAPSLS